jgi:hypothetical protein
VDGDSVAIAQFIVEVDCEEVTNIPTDPLGGSFSIKRFFVTKYNTDYAFGDMNTVLSKVRYYFEPTLLAGLGIPAANLRTNTAYRVNGAQLSGLNMGGRTVILTIPVMGDIQAKRAEIIELFAQDPSVFYGTYFDFCLELDSGYVLTMKRVVLNSVTEELIGPRGQFLNISLYSPDPFWYGNVTRSFSKSYTYTAPMLRTNNMNSSFPLWYFGSCIAYPVIVLTGRTYLFTIKNMNTGKLIGPINYETAADEAITISTAPNDTRSAISNIEGNIIDRIVGGDLDFYLDPFYSPNQIFVTGSVVSGTATVGISWRETFIGV